MYGFFSSSSLVMTEILAGASVIFCSKPDAVTTMVESWWVASVSAA
jgi:hypothetical protein